MKYVISGNQLKISLRKAGDDLYFAIFLPDAQNCVYIAGYLLITDDEYSVHYDHIWQGYNVFNNT